MTTNLITLNNSGIQINTEIVDASLIDGFMNNQNESLTLEQAEALTEARYQDATEVSTENSLDGVVTEGLNDDDDLDSVLAKVMQTLSGDADFADVSQKQIEEFSAQSKQNVVSSFTSQPTQALIDNNQSSLTITKQETSTETVIEVNGETAIIIPKSERGTALAVSVEMILAWTFLIWHSVSFLAIVIGFMMPSADNKKVKTVSSTVQKSSSVWSKFVGRMKAIADKVTASERVKQFIHALKVINVFKHLYAVVKAILSHMSKWDLFVALADFLSSVALIFITAGADLVRKMIKLAVNLIHVIDDVLRIIDLEKRHKVANLAA